MLARRPMQTVGGAILALLTACGGASTESSSTEEASAPDNAGPSASASPSEPGESEAAGAGELCAVEFETCPLDAGTYSSSPFDPEFTFVVDDGWTNERAWPDGGGVSKEGGAVYWISGVTTGMVAEHEIEIGADVEGFMTFLQSLEAVGMTVSEATEVEVDGAAGMQIDVETNEVEAPGLMAMESDSFNLAPGETARFLVLDVDGETVVLIIDAFLSEDFESVVAIGEPVIASIRWEP